MDFNGFWDRFSGKSQICEIWTCFGKSTQEVRGCCLLGCTSCGRRSIWLSKPMVPFWGRCSHFLVSFSGDWDVHWGYDLAFDPWSFFLRLEVLARQTTAEHFKGE